MAKKSKDMERLRQEKRKTKRMEKALVHYSWTFGVLAITFCLSVFMPWPGFKVILVLATLWASLSPDGLDQNQLDEVRIGGVVFVVRNLLLGTFSLVIGQVKPNFFTYFGGSLVIFLVLAFCGFLLQMQENHKKKLAIAYQIAQDDLSKKPGDPLLRQAALQAGRKYYSACRGDGTITIYDEAAINNDIQACLGDRSGTSK